MLDKTFWAKIYSLQSDADISRRKIIAESAGAQHVAKQAIFALQRDNIEEAKEKLAAAENGLISLDKRFGKDARLRMEGAWKAAVEEFLEAKLFYDFYSGKKITGIKGFFIDSDEYLGALSDMTGEIVRLMVLWTAKNEIDKVKASAKVIDEVIHDLMQNNLTGYLRTKFDQAKKNLQKSESILYDLAIRKM